MKREPLVKLMNIQKSFGRVYALEEINLSYTRVRLFRLLETMVLENQL